MLASWKHSHQPRRHGWPLGGDQPTLPGSPYLAAWEIFNNPAVNPYGGSGMQGEYGGQAAFILTLGAGGPADGVSFTFNVEVTN